MPEIDCQPAYPPMKLFSPAIALMNRLSFAKKFVLFGAIALVAAGVFLHYLYVGLNRQIHVSTLELAGVGHIRSISLVVRHLQQHRGLSAVARIERLASARDAKGAEVSAGLAALERQLTQRSALRSDLKRIGADWSRLHREGHGMSPEENFAAHTALIDRLQAFEVNVADTFFLTLDWDVGTYYLILNAVEKLPIAIERLGRIRARGTGMLATNRVSHSQKLEMTRLIAELDHELPVIALNLEKVARHHPDLRATLSARSERTMRTIRQAADLARSNIVEGRLGTSPQVYFEAMTQAIDEIYTGMDEFLLPTIEALIETRIRQTRDTLHLSLGIALLATLAIAYFATGGFLALSRNIRSLAVSARAFAGGDITKRVRLETRDELWHIGESFNEMAAGFSALLAERQKIEHALRTNEERLRLATAAAESASRAKSELLANVSHEIRTPLNAIVGLSHLCLETGLDATQRGHLEKVSLAANALLRIISDILDYSKIEAGRLTLETVPFDLQTVLGDLASLATVQATEKGIALTVEMAPDVPTRLVGDPLRLGQVLLNLVGNAVKFTEHGKVHVLVSLVTQAAADEDVVLRFDVRDTGIGISEAQIARLFAPFTQADTSTTRRYGGTGLGLSISRRLVELMEGEIHVESEPGQGARFSFTARFRRSPRCDAPLPEPASKPSAWPLARGETRGHALKAAPVEIEMFRSLLDRAQVQLKAFDVGIEDTILELESTDALPPVLAQLIARVSRLVAIYDYESALDQLQSGLKTLDMPAK